MKSDNEKNKMKEFGAYLSDLRNKKNVSVRDVAEGTKISNPYLYQIENGVKALTDPANFLKLALYFNIPVENLLKKAGYLPDDDPYKDINKEYEKVQKLVNSLPNPRVATLEQKIHIVDIYKAIEEKLKRENSKKIK